MKSSEFRLKIPNKLVPVFTGKAMYRGAYGGRGSAKTRTFCKMAAVKGLEFSQMGIPGLIVCGREYQNTLEDSSFSEVREAIFEEEFLRDRYDIGEKFIRTSDGNVDFSFVGLRHNVDSIKSKSRIILLYVDEAENVSENAWNKADRTVREEDAEVWATWNPERKGSPTDTMWRQNKLPFSKVVKMNWRDNPWFPKRLEILRQSDLENKPELYGHLWEGDYLMAQAGAYFSKQINAARLEHRIGIVPEDPIITYGAFWDIGGTGAKADACSIWIAQIIGREVRILNYYEAVGQELKDHIYWMQSQGYMPNRTTVYLPHDGVTHDRVFRVTYESEIMKAGYKVQTIQNQGTGAVKQRIEASRKMFPYCFFNESTTESGLDALGWYHEKVDEKRVIGLGPEHDWSSHGADAFGLMATVVLEKFGQSAVRQNRSNIVYGSHKGWLGA